MGTMGGLSDEEVQEALKEACRHFGLEQVADDQWILTLPPLPERVTLWQRVKAWWRR